MDKFDLFGILKLSRNAHETVTAVGLTADDVRRDIAELRTTRTRESLLDMCLAGAELGEEVAGWTEYVDACVAKAGVSS